MDGLNRKQLASLQEPFNLYMISSLQLSARQALAMDTLAEFEAWYEAVNGVPFQSGYLQEDSAPLSSTNARRTNEMSRLIGIARDEKMLDVIAHALNGHDNVLVIYGASHHVVQSKALEAMLGTPGKLHK